MYSFKAEIEIIGVNPFVFVPRHVLQKIFKKAGKEKGYIRVYGTVNDKPYKQTLVRYSGEWRLYINMVMLKNSPGHIGETIKVKIDFDPESREMIPPPGFIKALSENKEAMAAFNAIPPSRKMEIVRYLANLKTAAALERNIKRAINFLSGRERFIGRDKP